jgi:hypothetical protein
VIDPYRVLEALVHCVRPNVVAATELRSNPAIISGFESRYGSREYLVEVS